MVWTFTLHLIDADSLISLLKTTQADYKKITLNYWKSILKLHIRIINFIGIGCLVYELFFLAHHTNHIFDGNTMESSITLCLCHMIRGCGKITLEERIHQVRAQQRIENERIC